MIYINNKEKLKRIKSKKNYYVITDFDRTLTTKESEPSMGVIPNYLGGECLKERTKIFEHYRPIELDYTLDVNKKKQYMKKWAKASFEMLSKYVKQEIIEESLKDSDLYLREGVKEFLKELKNKNILVIVMSSGIGNIVKGYLEKENCIYENMTIISNFFEFNNDKVQIDLKNVMATSSKEYKRIPKELRHKINKIKYGLLFGDLVEDLRMVNEKEKQNILTFGFLDENIEKNLNEFNKNYDIVLTENEDFNTVKNILN